MCALKRYQNPYIKNARRSLWDVILWQIGYYNDPNPPPPMPKDFSYPLPTPQHSFYTATWINHSTYLLKMNAVHILTDPIWSARCSPLPFLGPKRQHPPPLSLENLPVIDYVLISHNHYDHLDAPTVDRLFRLFPDITWLVPKGLGNWFRKRKIIRYIECDWWESVSLQPGWRCTAVPAQHYSGRKGIDVNKSLWAGWVIENGEKNCYFAGDTGYNPYDFQAIGGAWKAMDLSLIPIGCYVPRKFMSPVHIEPKDAVRIHQEVGSRLSLGTHWNTFRLSSEPKNRPPYDLFLAMQAAGLDPHTFLAPPPGYPISF